MALLNNGLGARLGRRQLLRASGAAALAATGLGMARPAAAQVGVPTPGDIAVLKFLAAAELVEDDLWQQYCELATDNPDFARALRKIDPSLPRYICDDRDDERSHALLINGYLQSIGETPVNLDAFRTLPSVPVRGAQSTGRLTSLTQLNVDTSWYMRYRGQGNPDFGDQFPQLVQITGKPTVPTSNRMTAKDVQAVAHAAAFHFAAIEQGGGSLYCGLLSKVTHPDVVAILASIGPVEVYHFAAFHKSLELLPGLRTRDGVVFPNLRARPDTAQAIFPEPCRFLQANLPLCSVIRPRSEANAGALAAATGLVQSGLFNGQPDAFFQAVVALATAADAAERM